MGLELLDLIQEAIDQADPAEAATVQAENAEREEADPEAGNAEGEEAAPPEDPQRVPNPQQMDVGNEPEGHVTPFATTTALAVIGLLNSTSKVSSNIEVMMLIMIAIYIIGKIKALWYKKTTYITQNIRNTLNTYVNYFIVYIYFAFYLEDEYKRKPEYIPKTKRCNRVISFKRTVYNNTKKLLLITSSKD
jgi:hypothetical protein